MAINEHGNQDFPENPTNNDVWVDDNDVQWRFNGSEWAIFEPYRLGDLKNVEITGEPKVNDIIEWDGTKWVNVTGTYSLNEINDVDLTNLADGNFLLYNADTQTWYNKTPPLIHYTQISMSNYYDFNGGTFTMDFDTVDYDTQTGQWNPLYPDRLTCTETGIFSIHAYFAQRYTGGGNLHTNFRAYLSRYSADGNLIATISVSHLAVNYTNGYLRRTMEAETEWLVGEYVTLRLYFDETCRVDTASLAARRISDLITISGINDDYLENLVARYPLVSTTTTTDTTSGYNGILYLGGPSANLGIADFSATDRFGINNNALNIYEDPAAGTAYHDTRMEVPDSVSGTDFLVQTFSIAFWWKKPDNYWANNRILSIGGWAANGWYIQCYDDTHSFSWHIDLKHDSSTATQALTIATGSDSSNLNRWRHCVITFEKDVEANLYIDGALVGGVACPVDYHLDYSYSSGQGISGPYDLMIGNSDEREYNYGRTGGNVHMNDLRFYSTILSENQVVDIYNYTKYNPYA